MKIFGGAGHIVVLQLVGTVHHLLQMFEDNQFIFDIPEFIDLFEKQLDLAFHMANFIDEAVYNFVIQSAVFV